MTHGKASRRLALTLALLTAPATAQDLSPAEASVLPRIIDTLCLNLDDDRNGCETALLVTSLDDPIDVDLIILSDRRSGPVETLATIRDLVWDGPAFGQAPWLEQAGTGYTRSLKVLSENIGVGRNAWTQTLTIAYRGGEFVLAGFTYSSRDRLNTVYGTCDVNLLSGSWETLVGIGASDDPAKEASGRGDPDIRPVADWAATLPLDFPAACQPMFDALDALSDFVPPE